MHPASHTTTTTSIPRTTTRWYYTRPIRILVGICAVCGCRGAPEELAVPDVEQDTDYTCSASALRGVLAYYGKDLAEAPLASELGATPQDGAPPEAIARVARAHGLDAAVHD